MIAPKHGGISAQYFTSLAMTVQYTFVSVSFPIFFVFHILDYLMLLSKTNQLHIDVSALSFDGRNHITGLTIVRTRLTFFS
jgi:hypothetical protein